MREWPIVGKVALVVGAAGMFLAVPAWGQSPCCAKACVDSDGMGSVDDSIQCNPAAVPPESGTTAGCVEEPGGSCVGGRVDGPMGPEGCACVSGTCEPAGEQCTQDAAANCVAAGNGTTTVDDADCGGDGDCSDPNSLTDEQGNPCL